MSCMHSETTDDILTVSQVARRLQVASSWVYAHPDLLGAFKLGKYLRFSWKRVLERLEETSLTLGVAAQRSSERAVDSDTYK
jgi:hypothetical protein